MKPATEGVRGKLDGLRKFTRYKVRFVLAIAFWLHAIGVTHLIRVHFATQILRARLFSEVVLLATIFFYSYLASNGWWSLFFDLGYVYLFPLWLIAKYGWKLTRLTTAPVGRHLMKSAAFSAPVASTKESSPKEPNKPAPSTSRDSLARPFQQFALLWCGVVLLNHTKVLTGIAVAVITLAIIKAIVAMNGFLNGSMEWLTKTQDRMAEVLNKTIQQAMQQDPQSKEFRSSVVSVRFYEGALRWLCNRDGVEGWVQGATLLLLVPYYLYLSILSGFVYFGAASILGFAWSAKEALLDSLFMPLAWTDLPHSVLIRALAGIQVCVLAFISYEAIFRRISNKADRIARTAEELSRKFADPALQAKILIISTPTTSVSGDAQAATIAQENTSI